MLCALDKHTSPRSTVPWYAVLINGDDLRNKCLIHSTSPLKICLFHGVDITILLTARHTTDNLTHTHRLTAGGY